MEGVLHGPKDRSILIGLIPTRVSSLAARLQMLASSAVCLNRTESFREVNRLRGDGMSVSVCM